MTGQYDSREIIDSSVMAAADDYAARFEKASPFRHVAIDGFLNEDFCRAICEEFPDFDRQGAINEDGKVGGKSTQERVRELGPAFRRLDDLVQQPSFLSLIGKIAGIEDLRYDPHYFGGGTHENREGQDLDPHIDFNYHPISRQHRRLNLIIYLNGEWDDSWGGSLQLHRDPYSYPAEDEIVTLTPLMNRCVLFETTEHSWHGFERISLPEGRSDISRRSFALYFYTPERPPEETGLEHSTVYVERHLSERFQAGMVLEQADLDEIRLLLHRRDLHLKRLYRTVGKLMGKLNQPWQQATVTALRRRIYEFETSTSWKVTAPLRAAKRILRPGRDTDGRK